LISEWLPELRYWLYKKNYLRRYRPQGLLVSVGNLRMGGSGKTPFIDLLLRELAKKSNEAMRQKPILVVSRNYKAEVVGCAEIQRDRSGGAAYYGDEPWLLAQKNPSVRFFVGPNKTETVQAAHSVFQPSLTLLDDGFQHLKLQRDLDIVILDPSDLQARIFPWGPLREGPRSLRRARWIVVNFLAPSNQLQNNLQKEYADVKKQVAALAGFPHQFALVQGRLSLDPSQIQKAKALGWAAFAGIARPERFRQALESEIQQPAKKFWTYSNHHQYEANGPPQVLEWMAQNPHSLVFTTEKDAVKLALNEGLRERIIAVPWRLEFHEGRELVDELGKLMEAHRG